MSQVVAKDGCASPLVSIIVPVYGVERYLDRCVESIVAQTYRNLEIILVDDGSPDRCPAMCDMWASKDARVTVIHQSNAGVSAARNVALDHCGGEWVCFVDSDDYLEPDACERLLCIVDGRTVDAVIFGHVTEDIEDVQETVQHNNVGSDESSDDTTVIVDRDGALRLTLSAGGCKGYIWNRMYRASVIDKEPRLRFSEQAHFCEDMLFNVAFFMRGGAVAVTDDILYHYRDNDDSVVHTITEKNETFSVAMDAVIALLPAQLKPIAGYGYALMALDLLYWSYDIHDAARVDRYRRMMNAHWPDYWARRKDSSVKVRIRMAGAHWCDTIFCPCWNMLKKLVL